MIGLGCGARSYTDALHYSYEYAVAANEVRKILSDYIDRDQASFSQIEFGYHLDAEDQRRRFLILSLLQCSGVCRSQYVDRFGGDPLDDFPSLDELADQDYLEITTDRLRLTDSGLECSDAIGPWLNSARVDELISH